MTSTTRYVPSSETEHEMQNLKKSKDIYEERPESNDRSRITAAQVTRVLPVKECVMSRGTRVLLSTAS